MGENLIETVHSLIKHLNIPVTKSSIILELEKSPDKENLYGISSALDKWNINNAAYGFAADELENDHCPFIASLVNDQSVAEFAFVEEITENSFIVSNERWSKKSLSKEKFNAIFGGVVLVVEAEDGAGESNYKLRRRKEVIQNLRTPFVCFSILLVLLNILIQNKIYDLRIESILVLKFLGLFFSSCLIIKSIRPESPFLKNLCFDGKHTGCESDFPLSATTLFSIVSWSEIGLFYFSWTTLLLLFQNHAGFIQLNAYLNLFCLPFIVYSISYQAIVLKKWCLLCCMVQICLFAEFLINIRFLQPPLFNLSPSYLGNVTTLLLIPVSLWVFIKPLLIKSELLNTTKEELSRFKFNTELFGKTLKEQPTYKVPSKNYSIVLGNPDSEKIVTIVSNPYCSPCSKLHHDIDRVLDTTNDLQIRLILTDSNNNDVNKHIISLDKLSNNTVKRAIADWYGQPVKNFNTWATKHPVKDEHSIYRDNFDKQGEWCKEVNITFTPLIIVDGHKLPEPYLIEDLIHLL